MTFIRLVPNLGEMHGVIVCHALGCKFRLSFGSGEVGIWLLVVKDGVSDEINKRSKSAW